mgnify:CR=1 FL=1
MNLAIIPARSGSKRIKNKNIIDFYGKPIIYYSINTALKSNLFDKIIVSTDSKNIAKIANKFGAETPFKRPKHLAKDNISTSKVIKHGIDFYSKKGIKFKNICCIYPASPMIKIGNLKKCLKLLNHKNTEYSFPVSEYEYPIQRSFKLKKNNISKMINEEFYKFNTNDLMTYYHDCGQFYWGKKESWINEKKIFNINTKVIKVPHHLGIDIDTKEDLEHVKIIYGKLFNE